MLFLMISNQEQFFSSSLINSEIKKNYNKDVERQGNQQTSLNFNAAPC